MKSDKKVMGIKIDARLPSAALMIMASASIKKKKKTLSSYKKREQFDYKKTRSCPFPLKSLKTTSLHKHSSTCALYVTLDKSISFSILDLLHTGLVQSDYRHSGFFEPFFHKQCRMPEVHPCGGEWCVRH